MANINYEYFKDININDTFFDSLKNDYEEFEGWFSNKAQSNAMAYTFYQDRSLNAFLYLKFEDEEHLDIEPQMQKKHRLKVGTFKIDAHGTKLGERFVKKIIDVATENSMSEVYVTIFEDHEGLISLLTTFGFVYYGIKNSVNGSENVYVKKFNTITNNILNDYPLVKIDDVNKYVLGIYPKFHSRLFPDSILTNENFNVLTDISPTNSIHKMYICSMKDVQRFQGGDLVLIYRTNDGLGPAKYRSVITSVCTVEEVKNMNEFHSLEDYLDYCDPYSIFTESELRLFYQTRKYPFIIKMVYNLAFKKRVIKGYLDEIGINPSYWGVFQVGDDNFRRICMKGEVNTNLFYNSND